MKNLILNGGVFAGVKILADTPILEFKGNLYKSNELIHLQEEILQIGPELYLGPSGEIDDHIRHSCNPNCRIHIIGNRAILYSLYNIDIGMEITFDYSTTCDDSFSMVCNCGESNCRRVIGNYKSLGDISNYEKLGVLPLYITSNIFRK